MRARLCLAIATVLAAASLTACGDPDDDSTPSASDSASPTEPTETPAASPSPSSTEDSSEPDPDQLTPPGSELEVGEQATVPFAYGDAKGTIAVTVTSVDQGTVADLKPLLRPGRKDSSFLPYFINLEVEAVARAKGLAFSRMSSNISGVVEPSGRALQIPAALSRYQPCPDKDAPYQWQVGDSYRTCVLLLVRKGEKFVRPVYILDDTRYEFYEEPISWQ